MKVNPYFSNYIKLKTYTGTPIMSTRVSMNFKGAFLENEALYQQNTLCHFDLFWGIESHSFETWYIVQNTQVRTRISSILAKIKHDYCWTSIIQRTFKWMFNYPNTD